MITRCLKMATSDNDNNERKNVRIVAIKSKHNALTLMRQLAIIVAPPGKSLLPTAGPRAPNDNVAPIHCQPPTIYAPASTSVLSLTGTKLPLTSRFPRIISHRKTLKINAPSYTACKQPPLSTPWESPTARTPTPLQFHLAPSLGSCKRLNPPLPQICHGSPQKPKQIFWFLPLEYELSQSHLEII